MSNFDDIFEPARKPKILTKRLGRQRKRQSVTRGMLLPTPPPKKSAQTAASSVTIWMCRQNFIATPLLTPF